MGIMNNKLDPCSLSSKGFDEMDANYYFRIENVPIKVLEKYTHYDDGIKI